MPRVVDGVRHIVHLTRATQPPRVLSELVEHYGHRRAGPEEKAAIGLTADWVALGVTLPSRWGR
jgi:hypothetical protein